MWVFGFPVYLTTNYSGRDYAGQKTSHFHPSSPIFKPHEFWDIIVSDIGIFLVLAICGWASYVYSPLAVFKYYVMPYLVVNAWISTITYLQHTSSYLPHYRDNVWNFQRGAALTIDRSYGRLLNHMFHHLPDSHVAHHFFPMIPHYHAVEATKHVKKVLGKYYFLDNTPIWTALLQTTRECKLVEDNGDVVFYKKE